MLIRQLVFGLVLALMLAPIALLAANKKSPGTPAPTPAPTPAGTDTVYTKVFVAPNDNRGRLSPTPGPMLAPGSPIANRTTIAPFPIPRETSLTARELSKQLNRPREGVTALEPFAGGALRDDLFWDEIRRGSFRMSMPPQRVDSLPKRLTEPEPVYPKAALDARVEGTVLVIAFVMPNGAVGQVNVVRSVPLLDDAAIEAVKRMRFQPATYQGKPVAAWVGVPVTFTLH